MIKLGEILEEIRKEQDYKNLLNEEDQIIFEQFVELGEILNPNNSYNYSLKRGFKEVWEFNDKVGNTYFARIVYQPLKDPFFELKTGYYNDKGETIYDPNVPSMAPSSTAQDVHTRGDTVAKIFRDEIIPYFLNQNLSNKLVIKPIDIKRYQFAIRMVNKFTLKNQIKIVENKPNEIILIKI